MPRAHPFHEIAVAGDDVGPVVDQFVAEARVQHALGHRHPDGRCEPLTQRSRGHLDADGTVDLRMAGEVERGVEQHRP